MRVITADEFWDKVKERLGEEGYAELLNRANGEAAFKTLEEAERHWRNKTIPVMIEAGKINGCTNEDGQRRYYEGTISVYLPVVEAHPELLRDVNEPGAREQVRVIKEREAYPLFAKVEERFRAAHVCHGSDGGYVCYCDEKEGSAEE